MNGFSDNDELRAGMCEIGRRLYQRGLCSGHDGNLSIRLSDDRVLCTPTGVCKGFLVPDDLCVVGMSGNQLSGPRARTTEILLHLEIYAGRPDVLAVVHSHPPHATAFAISAEPFPAGLLAEAAFCFGEVPTAPYAQPGTLQFAQTVTPFLPGTCAILLANHGTVTFAESIDKAWALTESLENCARTFLAAKCLGKPSPLSDAARAGLNRLRSASPS